MHEKQVGHSEGKSGALLLAAVLGISLLLLSLLRVFGDLNSSAGHVSLLHSALSVPIWQTRLGFNVALFIGALMALHLTFGLLCWALALLSQRAYAAARLSRSRWLVAWFLAGCIWILIGNATRFPHSSLGEPYHHLMRGELLGITWFAAATALLSLAVVTTILMALWRWKGGFAALFAAALSTVAATGFALHQPAGHARTSASPDVIILGVDSLRTDAVAAHAPNIDDFLRQAIRFDDTITPLARTFPSWISILTGRHPHTTGAYMNLLPRSLIHTGSTLPQMLQNRGFRTFYAIDETRFSNLDTTYGFDRMISPAIGGTDFVLALCADTPLSNLVLNTSLGAWLFPHVHANRAAHFTYDPDAFVHRLERELRFDRPIMLAAHLTLAHFPFTWATSTAATGNDRLGRGDYLEAVARVDVQFRDLLAMLERRGVLENAIVIVLSDHGEAIGREDDLVPEDFPGKDDPDNEFQRWGHGSSVFSPSQYKVVLGMRAYGAAAHMLPPARSVAEPVSLVDLTPTILDLLDVPATETFDGVSLVPLMRDPHATARFADRIRYTESEFNPPGLSTRHATTSAIKSAADVYRLDPVTDRLEVRREKLDWIMSQRQFAALLGNRALGAAIPATGDRGAFQFVLLPLEGAPVLQDEAKLLRDALARRYQIRYAEPANGF